MASYNTQYFEPYNRIWDEIEDPDIDTSDLRITSWMHDLFRPSHHPYDPKEIAVIKDFTALADREYKRKI